jgi:hypothetical protein
VPHRPRISWSTPAHLIQLEALTDFDRSCFRVLPAEGFSLSRLLKFPFRSNFQQGQVAVFRFLSEDWSPWVALARMRERWPGLRFDMRAGYLEMRISEQPECRPAFLGVP